MILQDLCVLVLLMKAAQAFGKVTYLMLELLHISQHIINKHNVFTSEKPTNINFHLLFRTNNSDCPKMIKHLLFFLQSLKHNKGKINLENFYTRLLILFSYKITCFVVPIKSKVI